MNWQGLLEAVVYGVTTAVVWAGILWLVNLLRNHRVESQLRKSLARIGVSAGADGFGVIIKNESDYEITVRDVTLLTNDPEKGISLNYVGEIIDYTFQEKPFRDPRKMTLLRRVPIEQPKPPQLGLVTLGPKTGGTWQAPNALFAENTDVTPTKCHAAIMYKTIFGTPKILVVESEKGNANLLRDQYGKHIEQLKKRGRTTP